MVSRFRSKLTSLFHGVAAEVMRGFGSLGNWWTAGGTTTVWLVALLDLHRPRTISSSQTSGPLSPACRHSRTGESQLQKPARPTRRLRSGREASRCPAAYERHRVPQRAYKERTRKAIDRRCLPSQKDRGRDRRKTSQQNSDYPVDFRKAVRLLSISVPQCAETLFFPHNANDVLVREELVNSLPVHRQQRPPRSLTISELAMKQLLHACDLLRCSANCPAHSV